MAYNVPAGQTVYVSGQILFKVLLSAALCKVECSLVYGGQGFISLDSHIMVSHYMKTSAVLNNLFAHKHTVQKSWFSIDDEMESSLNEDLDKNLYLSHRLEERHRNDSTHRDKGQNCSILS